MHDQGHRSPICRGAVQMVTGQLADTPSRGLPTRGLDKSLTEHLADATGDFACLVFVFWAFIDVFLRAYGSDSVSCIICPHTLIAIKTSTTAGGIRELSSYRADDHDVAAAAGVYIG